MFDSLERSLHRMMIANTVHVVFWTRVEAIQVRESKILFRESFAKLTYYASSFCTIGIISAKVPRKLHEAGGPWSLSHVINYFPNSQQSVMRTGSVILAACFPKLSWSNPWSCGRQWLSFHKRHCFPTRVPPEINMEFAMVSWHKVQFREKCPFPDEKMDQRCIYGPVSRHPPPMGWVPREHPLPFYLQAIGSISEVQPRIW